MCWTTGLDIEKQYHPLNFVFSPLNSSVCLRNEGLDNHAWINVEVAPGQALVWALGSSFFFAPNY